MGVFSTGQFLGAAFGGALGGWVYAYYQMEGLAWLSGLLMFGWVALFQSAKGKVREWVVPAALADDSLLQQRVEQLEQLEGVYQARYEKQSSQVVWSVVARPNALDRQSLEAQLR